MATGGDGETYGVGPAAKQLNTGPNVNVDAVLQADGSVKIGKKIGFDPSDDLVELKQDDPEIDYAASVGAGDSGDADEDAAKANSKK